MATVLPGGISSRHLRGKIHSSLGGREAYLTFELKDRRPSERYYGATAISIKASLTLPNGASLRIVRSLSLQRFSFI
jgi:hypothetical protein